MVVTPGDALIRLGESAGAAVLEVLGELGVGPSELGAAQAVERGGSVFDGFELPVVATSVADGDGTRTTLVLTVPGARRLVAAIAGAPPAEDGAEPEEADAAEVAEAANRIAAAAASAAREQLGADAEPAPPETQLVSEQGPADAYDAGALVVSVALQICGEPAALVQLVPAELADRLSGAAAAGTEGDGAIAGDSLREVRVRLWAELGRTRMALGRAVGLAPGEVVELDAAVDDPVDIFVNGVRLGNGHLVVGDDGEWAFRVAEVSAGPVLDRALEGFDPSGAERTLVDREET